MAELKPCPFCGSENVELRKGIMYNGAVHCNDCGADVIFEGVTLYCEETGDTWQEAETVRWNRRADNG